MLQRTSLLVSLPSFLPVSIVCHTITFVMGLVSHMHALMAFYLQGRVKAFWSRCLRSSVEHKEKTGEAL